MSSSLPLAHLVTDPAVRATYGLDHSLILEPPDPSSYEVVRARDVGDVVDVMRHAHATGTPVVPQGARTGLVGGAVAIPGGIVLNVEHLDAITEIDDVEAIAVCGPGVVTADLKRAVAAHGLFYPPDPGSVDSCTIGGNVATNAGGLCCVKYGVTADYVRGLQVVLPGGEFLTTGRRTAKGVTGYDLTGLFVGSEGTLGVVTSVITKLVPASAQALTALATFETLAAASAAIVAMRRLPQRPSLLEFLDAASIEAIQAIGDFGFPSGCAAALLVQSDRDGFTGADVATYASVMSDCGADEVAIADDPDEGELLLAGRRSLNAAFEHKGPRLAEDMCVPIARLADLVSRGLEIGARHGVEVTMSGHGGDGNLHPSIFFDPRDEASTEAAWATFDELVTLTLELGGTIAGEHGIGTLKAPWLRREVGSLSYDLQRRVKAVFDPKNVMNPGRVFAAAT